MSRATVTVRELKNKETGIDLSVTSFKETKGMLGSSFEYQVVVVSNLSCFKSAKHKETDNVQFTVMKKLTDFEDLHGKFNTKYSGTAFPLLPKKVLMMNVEVAKERRNNLDHFVKFLACSPKLCTDTVLLEFLGVSSVKAGKLQKMEVSESIVNKPDDIDNKEINETKQADDDTNDDLFGEDDAENEDDEDLFGTEEVSTDKDVKIFEDQDFSGALEEGEGDDLFITGARSEVKVVSKATDSDQEDSNDDLFRTDDDLDDIMNMIITTKVDKESEVVDKTDDDVVEETNDSNDKGDISVDQLESVPVTKPLKPALKAKPALPKRKDKILTNEATDKEVKPDTDADKRNNADVKSGTKPKPPLKKKPVVAGKPNLKPKPSLKPKPVEADGKVGSGVNENVEIADASSDVVEQISTGDDILKYIQDNAANEEDIDLFS